MKKPLSSSAKIIRKHLNAAARAVHKFASDAEYYHNYDGPLWQNVNRFHRKKWRKKAKITKAINTSAQAAQVVGDAGLIEAIEEIRRLAKIVLANCDYFPNADFSATTWEGQEWLDQFDADISCARRVALTLRGIA